MCFVELGSPEEAQRAVKELDKSSLMNSSIVVSTPLKEGFRWGLIEKPTKHPYESRFFLNEGNNAEEALKPLAEGRRMALSVQTPGWSPGAKIGEATENALKIIEQNFAKYGVESISNISVFYGDKKTNPRLLCFIDFKTKEGTEQAAKDKHDTEINSRLVWLKPSIPAGWRVHQFWKSAPRVVEQLQEKGVLTKEMDADKFNNPLPKRQKKKKSQ
jgi:RNA recognition motif-containing protein